MLPRRTNTVYVTLRYIRPILSKFYSFGAEKNCRESDVLKKQPNWQARMKIIEQLLQFFAERAEHAAFFI
jgi:hypothetical protein